MTKVSWAVNAAQGLTLGVTYLPATLRWSTATGATTLPSVWGWDYTQNTTLP